MLSAIDILRTPPRRLQRLSRLLLGHLGCGKLVQLFVHERQELLCGVEIALLDLGQDLRDAGHSAIIADGKSKAQVRRV